MDNDFSSEALVKPHNESDHSLIGPRAASVRSEAGSARNSGHPFKRYPVGARPNSDISNNIHKERTSAPSNGSAGETVLTCRTCVSKGSKIEKAEVPTSKGRSCIFSILITVVICCFLAEAMLQGTIMMLLKQTDLNSQIGTSKSQSSGTKDVHERYSMEYRVRFLPWKFEQIFSYKGEKASLKDLRMLKHFSVRPPLLALVCLNLERNAEFLYLITIAKGIQELGYKLELYAFSKGPMEKQWANVGVIANFIHLDGIDNLAIDWSKFEGVVVNSLHCRPAIMSLMQEPFKKVPVIWVIPEDTLGDRLRLYEADGMMDLVLHWKQAFTRADAVVFPDYYLSMMYSTLDTGNQIVIPGFPSDVWEAEQYMALHKREYIRESFGLQPKDIVIAVVGNAFSYKGVWREHAFVMKAFLPVVKNLVNMDGARNNSLKIVFIYGKSSTDYLNMLQKMALHLGFASEAVFHFGVERDLNGLLWAADAVVYCSLWDEQYFPKTISRSMAFGRPIVAPNSSAIKMHIVDGVNGLLFSPANVTDLTATFFRVFSNYGVSTLAQKVASEARSHARSILAEDAVVGYAKLLETVLQFSSETMLPLPISNLSHAVKRDWQWQLLADVGETWHLDVSVEDPMHANNIVYELEKQFNKTADSFEPSKTLQFDDYDLLDHTVWDDAKAIQISEDSDIREEEEVEERIERLQASWEDVYRGIKKAEKGMHQLYETEDGELLRTGQPLCIYETYDGPGTWPFLHERNALYRGISMSPKQTRLDVDDIEAASRLPLLNNVYYQNVLCEYGAFFAIANHIDRIHRNAWIGFQPWQAAGRKVALSIEAEKVLVDAARTERDGDTIYFWARMQSDGGELLLNANGHCDFWLFCDAINRGQCRYAFLEAFKQMYGLPSTWTQVPPMPSDTGMWAIFDCWVMPTSSFLEFIMFARMFVNALDSQFYFEHHEKGKCSLGISDSEVQQCYCRLLELVVNVWAYHSARRMIYIDPTTGAMDEQHKLDGRRGQMWLKFFNHSTLAELDNDLAGEADDEQLINPGRRWLWPYTGEVFSLEISEREKKENYYLRLVTKKKNRERIERIRNRYKQNSLAGG